MIEGVNSDREFWGSAVVSLFKDVFSSPIKCIVVCVDSIREFSVVIVGVVCGFGETVKRNRISKRLYMGLICRLPHQRSKSF